MILKTVKEKEIRKRIKKKIQKNLKSCKANIKANIQTSNNENISRDKDGNRDTAANQKIKYSSLMLYHNIMNTVSKRKIRQIVEQKFKKNF